MLIECLITIQSLIIYKLSIGRGIHLIIRSTEEILFYTQTIQSWLSLLDIIFIIFFVISFYVIKSFMSNLKTQICRQSIWDGQLYIVSNNVALSVCEMLHFIKFEKYSTNKVWNDNEIP